MAIPEMPEVCLENSRTDLDVNRFAVGKLMSHNLTLTGSLVFFGNAGGMSRELRAN